MSEYHARLPADIDLPSVPGPGHVNRQYPSFASQTLFPTLNNDRIRSYAAAYFATFNIIYPILDETHFLQETLPPLLSQGFRYGDASSVLVLFVLALGQLAIDSLTSPPIEIVDGIPSGICGGSAQRAPGLDIFNEGRARIGSLVLRGDVISVQVLLLQGTYFEANGCHVEYWRSIMEASMVCQLLVQSPTAPWASMDGDLLRRSFWACLIDGTFYHLDLDLPGTNLGTLIDKVRLPNFSKALGSSPWSGGNKAQSLMEFYFLAKVSLLRVLSRIHQAMMHCKYSLGALHLHHLSADVGDRFKHLRELARLQRPTLTRHPRAQPATRRVARPSTHRLAMVRRQLVRRTRGRPFGNPPCRLYRRADAPGWRNLPYTRRRRDPGRRAPRPLLLRPLHPRPALHLQGAALLRAYGRPGYGVLRVGAARGVPVADGAGARAAQEAPAAAPVYVDAEFYRAVDGAVDFAAA